MHASSQHYTQDFIRDIPLQVAAEVEVRAELPDPLDPFEYELEFSWQSPEIPKIVSPLTEITVNSRFVPSGGGFNSDANDKYRIHTLEAPPELGLEVLPESKWQETAKESLVVPMDAESILAFGQAMNSSYFARHPSGDRPTYQVGPLKFTPRLSKVELFEHKKSEEWRTGWSSVAVSGDANKPLPGVWLAESDPQSPNTPASRRLQLGTDNPLIHSGRAPGLGANGLMDRPEKGLTLAERLLEDYPDLMHPVTEPKWVCIHFFHDDVGTVIPAGGACRC